MRRIIFIFAIYFLCVSSSAFAMQQIKNSATDRIPILGVDDIDGKTEETLVTWTINVSKNGGAFVAGGGTVTEVANGLYYYIPTATETNTNGFLCIRANAAGVRTFYALAQIVANIISDIEERLDGDGITDASVDMKVSQTFSTTGSVGSVTGSVNSVTSAVTVGTNNDKTGYALSVAGVDAIWDEAQSGHITAGTFGLYLDKAISAIDDNPWDAAIRSLTDKANFTLASGEYTNIWNTNISAYSGAGFAGTYLKNLFDNQNWNVWDDITRTLTSGGYSGLTSADIDNIWEYDKTLSTGLSAIGKHIVDNLNATVGSRSTLTAADVWGYASRALTDKANFTLATGEYANIWGYATRSLTDKTGFSLSAAAEDSIVDKNWDELISGHLTAGTTGAKLNAAGNAGDPWSVNISTGYTGQAGEYLRNVKDATDGDKEGADYSGVEKMIRTQR